MKKYLNKILILCSILLAVVAVCMLFAPAAVASAEFFGQKASTSYTGAQLAFGYTYKTEAFNQAIETEIFKASANLVPYLLLLIGVVFSVIAVLGKMKKFAPLVAAGCFLVAGVFFFLAVQLCVPAGSSSTAVAAVKDALSLGAGAIAGGVLSILAAISSAAAAVVKKK